MVISFILSADDPLRRWPASRSLLALQRRRGERSDFAHSPITPEIAARLYSAISSKVPERACMLSHLTSSTYFPDVRCPVYKQEAWKLWRPGKDGERSQLPFELCATQQVHTWSIVCGRCTLSTLKSTHRQSNRCAASLVCCAVKSQNGFCSTCPFVQVLELI
jgi:hypothetical protein